MRTGLFNMESLEKLRRSGFTGKLRISWTDGFIDDFSLTNKVTFSRHDKKEYIDSLLSMDYDEDDE